MALPDFSMYAFYASLSEEKLHVFKRDGAPTLDGLRAFVRETGSAAVIFSNPCNPTGQGYDRKSVLQFVLSADALCIIDEAYMDFWDPEHPCRRAVAGKRVRAADAFQGLRRRRAAAGLRRGQRKADGRAAHGEKPV